MKLSDKLALQLRLAKAYKNSGCKELAYGIKVAPSTISKYCCGYFGETIEIYEKCLNALGFELEIKLRRKEGDTNAN